MKVATEEQNAHCEEVRPKKTQRTNKQIKPTLQTLIVVVLLLLWRDGEASLCQIDHLKPTASAKEASISNREQKLLEQSRTCCTASATPLSL
jgi:hypothetical protein